MINYNKQLDILFESWKCALQHSRPEIDVESMFTSDGIMRHVPDAEEKWFSAKRRVAILMKDKSDRSGDDVRNWLNDNDNPNNQKSRRLGNDLFHNIANILYGLHYDEFDFEKVDGHQHTLNCLLNTPFAYIECKKIAGKGDLEDNVLKEYLTSDKEYLQMELSILKPNFIVCTHHLINDFVRSMYPKEELFIQSNNLAYHRKTNTIILLCYHPTAWSVSHLYHFGGAINHYRDFLKTPYGQDFLNKL